MNEIKIYKQDVPFVRVLIPFGLGIMSFYSYKTDWIIIQLVLIIIILFSYLFLRNTTYKNSRKQLDKGINGTILHLLFFIIGSLCVTLHNNHNNTDYYLFNNNKYLKIRIIDEPQNRQNIILFNASAAKPTDATHCKSNKNKNKHKSQSVSGKIKVTVVKNIGFPLTLKYGDELIIPAKFTETPPPSNPSEFNFKNWLATQNIYHQTILKQQELIKLNTNTGNKLIQYALQLRENQVNIYRRLIKNDDAFAVAATLILGYRSDLSSEILDIYSKTGTIHVLSVSGMHVGLVYLILNRLLCFFDRKPMSRIIKTLLIVITIWFYALLTGFSPSVLRASIMISVFIIAKLVSKNINNYNIIAFAAFCILLYNPFLIWDVGFQLSFMAVLGLIYLQPKIEQWLPLRRPWLAKLWSLVAISLAAQLATYPFSVYYFHQFPVYFLISNLFITIPSALIMYIGIIILLFRIDSLGPFFEWLINFTNAGLDQIARLPFSGITSIWINKTELVLLCLSLILFIIALSQFKKWLLIYSAILFLGLQCAITHDKLQALHQKKTVKFTVRKNHVYAIIYGRKAILLTDLKPNDKAFNYSIKPALDQHRVTQITFRGVNITGF